MCTEVFLMKLVYLLQQSQIWYSRDSFSADNYAFQHEAISKTPSYAVVSFFVASLDVLPLTGH